MITIAPAWHAHPCPARPISWPRSCPMPVCSWWTRLATTFPAAGAPDRGRDRWVPAALDSRPASAWPHSLAAWPATGSRWCVRMSRTLRESRW